MLISDGRVSISAEEGDENKARDDAGDDAEWRNDDGVWNVETVALLVWLKFCRWHLK